MRKFKCRYCGELFSLSVDDQKCFDAGYYLDQPDTCDFCSDAIETAPESGQSDADPGL